MHDTKAASTLFFKVGFRSLIFITHWMRVEIFHDVVGSQEKKKKKKHGLIGDNNK
jgi:hypothetical protein